VVRDIREGNLSVPETSPAHLVARHRDARGNLLSEQVAAVELLNIIRPTVAVAWYVAFAAHALHHHPDWRQRLQGGNGVAVWAFTDEVRRFYPFAPFLGARVRSDFTWQGQHFAEGRLVLLDLYGTNHHPAIWAQPGEFTPQRFMEGRARHLLVAQGGGDPHQGHRCPGEDATTRLMGQAAQILSTLDYALGPQDISIALDRIPTRPRSGVVIQVAADQTGLSKLMQMA
jgi:fatty-acid peroxygenase